MLIAHPFDFLQALLTYFDLTMILISIVDHHNLVSQVLSVFLVYNKVSVIMASGRELCYVLLLGILASYLIPFFALAKPSVVTCTILRLQALQKVM